MLRSIVQHVNLQNTLQPTVYQQYFMSCLMRLCTEVSNSRRRKVRLLMLTGRIAD
jgi:hypothetical protein